MLNESKCVKLAAYLPISQDFNCCFSLSPRSQFSRPFGRHWHIIVLNKADVIQIQFNEFTWATLLHNLVRRQAIRTQNVFQV